MRARVLDRGGRQVPLVVARLVAADSVRGDVGEERDQAVVVGLGDRIDLVVVAPGAAHREPQEGLARGADQVVELVVLGLQLVGRFVVPDPQPVVAGGGDRLVGDVLEFVARQLLADEAVVGLVVVQAVDDVVAVLPHVRLGVVTLERVRLAVPHDIEPMAGPLLAVVWRIEQLVDEPLVRVWSGVKHERFDLIRRRREADQIVEEPSDESALVALRRWREAGSFELAEYEPIDGVGRPIGIAHVGRIDRLWRDKRPVLLVLGAAVDPSTEGVDLLLRERAPFGGHPLPFFA